MRLSICRQRCGRILKDQLFRSLYVLVGYQPASLKTNYRS